MSEKQNFIGYWLPERKRQKYNWADFENACAERGFILKMIDVNSNLESQGPIHVFLHKLTDTLALAESGDQNAGVIVTRIQGYIRKHPELIVIDPLENVKNLRNRHKSYEIIQDGFQFNDVFTPNFIEIKSKSIPENVSLLKQNNIKFPFICKPLVAHGSKDAHKLDSGTSNSLLAAAKHLADSEIELIKTIESATTNPQEVIKENMSATSKKSHGQKRHPPIKPSAALVAAKRDAAQRKRLQGKKSDNTFVRDIYHRAIEALNMTRKATGLVFDLSMDEHRCLWDEGYPECPERFTRVLERCKELGLVERCKRIESRHATDDELLLKHTRTQIDFLKATEKCNDVEKLEKLSSKYDAIYIHPSTYATALLATGSTINLLENICKGEVQNGMAIIRPPGHHAMKAEYCGYCFFNNVAVGTQKILNSNLAKKILIVDWDVHHGQATQQMFYDDPRVVYFSIHRYEYGKFWPNLRESDFHYVGEEMGKGYNFNVPLNKTGMTNGDYFAIFHQVLLPMAYQFQPDLIIISAGYDAALGCPEGEMEVTPACYAHLLTSLLSLASGRVAVILEGGYCLKSLAEGAALTLRALLGDPCPMLHTFEPPSKSIRETILNVIYAHKPYWTCYQYQDTYNIDSVTSNAEENNNRHLPAVIYRGDETKPDFYETRSCYPIQSKETVQQIEKKLNALIQFSNLKKSPNRVCIVYDERMLGHINISDDTHPEKPDRISAIYSKHEENGLLKRCQILQGRMATEEELLLVHSKEYIETIKKTVDSKLKDLVKQASDLNSIYLHPETWTSACIAAGSVLQVVDNVLNGESQSGVAIVRPPGHHAEEDHPCGFCIFNNVALAAKYAVKCHDLKRVLIVDWDVHHGNGTQNILEYDSNVLYVSVHRYDNGSFFPNSKKANYTVVGSGPGEGFTVNIPWNKKGMGDAEYIAAFQQIVMPIAYQFNPQLVLISAGFDACIGDPLGGCKVSPETYGHLTHWLSSLANGRVIITLEGGYNVNSIAYAMTMCTKALLGDPPIMLDTCQAPCASAINTINNVRKTHKQYWLNLGFQMSLPKENVLAKTKVSHAKSNDRHKIHGDSSNKSESKIAFEKIENEKLDLKLRFDKSSLNMVTDEEILKLQNEVENMKIKNLAHTKGAEEIVGDQAKSAANAPSLLASRGCPKEVVNKNERDINRQGGSRAGSENIDDEPASSSSQNNSRQSVSTGNLTDYLSENLQALVDGEMFAIVPRRQCPHLADGVRDVPSTGIDVHLPCQECSSTAENWICLRCYTVHCARNINEHAIQHDRQLDHPLTLSFSDLSVWCYRCEDYIDNPRLYHARNAAYRSKFNQDLPWTYDELTDQRTA
ncbi:histone deacetylase 6 isoform X2 [Orussus abietinus]|uniref:histone deacetylase 6 isoform X2 n=1 Tax=Orussus abietinus TaxID=222816 RepID=UPI00062629BD|nr:histone deacetylase 6 isoform X2 [Orussus abietinus]